VRARRPHPPVVDAPPRPRRVFDDTSERRYDSTFTAHIAIGAFGHDLLAWADHFRNLNDRSPSAEELAESVRRTPPQRYRDMLDRALQQFATAAVDLLADEMERAREPSDDRRLQLAGAAADVVLAHHESARLDRLLADVATLAEAERRGRSFGGRLERFTANVANGVAVTVAVALLVVAAILILGGETGVRALLTGVLDAVSP
jgi:hypothetical protein